MAFTTITDEEIEGLGVTGLPDTPGLSTEDMQAKFDEYSVFLKDKFKNLIDELEAVTAATNIGAEVPQNVTADENIQSILEGLRQYVDDTIVAIGTSDMATTIYDPNRDGIIAPDQGGTGQTSLQATRNAMGLGNTLNALPIENGGTGQTTAAGVRNALGLGNTTEALPVANGGTGKTSFTEGTVLVGNGTGTPTERLISDVSGGVNGSPALTTAGALYSTKTALQNTITNMQQTFQAGVDAVYNACVAEGVTPSASTPTAIAQAIATIRSGGDATAAQILATKTAYSGKSLLTGSMTNRGAWTGTGTPSGNNETTVTIPAGYHNGSGKVTCKGQTSYSAGRTQGRADETSHTLTLQASDTSHMGIYYDNNLIMTIYLSYTSSPQSKTIYTKYSGMRW